VRDSWAENKMALRSTAGEKQRYDEIRRAGFVNVDQWDKEYFNADKQKDLLGLINKDPRVTSVK